MPREPQANGSERIPHDIRLDHPGHWPACGSVVWDPAGHVDPKTLPTPGEILASMSSDRVGGVEYDRAWSERARQTMW